jgi:hypothetical protein
MYEQERMKQNYTAEEIKHRILQYASFNGAGVGPDREVSQSHQNYHYQNQQVLHLHLSGITSAHPVSNGLVERQTELDDAAFLQATYSLTSDAFLEKVYWTYLQRAIDAEGKAFYLKLLEGGMLRQGVINSIQQSEEFRSKRKKT